MYDISDVTIKSRCGEEMETIINYNRSDDTAIISTADNTVLTKLKKAVKQNPDEYKVLSVYRNWDGDVTEVSVSCPKKYISFRTRTVKRELTDEQKSAASERLKVARSKRNGASNNSR